VASLVVFDLAGTTVQDDASGVSRAIADALEAAGHRPEYAAINACMGVKKIDAIRELVPGASESEVEKIHEDFRTRMIHHYRTAEVASYPGVTEMFQELRSQGVKIGLNTGFDAETVRVILDRLGWEHSVDAWTASDLVTAGRPQPFMIRNLMEQCGVSELSHVAKAGDTPIDVEEGMNTGVGLNIAVTYGTHSRGQLETLGADALVDSVSELRQLLLDWASKL